MREITIDSVTNRVADKELYTNEAVEHTIEGPQYPTERLIAAVYPYIKDKIQEHFFVVALDSMYQVISIRLTNIGTTDQVTPYIHDVFRDAILDSARAIVIVHNHPGQREPMASMTDVDLTQMLVEAGMVVDIVVVDHLIVTPGGKILSFVDAGIMPEPLTEEDMESALDDLIEERLSIHDGIGTMDTMFM